MVDGTRKTTTRTRVRLYVVVLVTLLVAVGCGSDDEAEAPFAVSERVVSHETTQDISVFAPEAEGSWPVVYLLHGYDGIRRDLAETATQLASQGFVVFVPDYRSTDAIITREQDVECSYRYARSIAAEHGGDLDQPVTFVGYSHGASWALGVGVGETFYGPGGDFAGACFTGASRPDVVVAIAGCHYEYDGQPVLPIVDLMVEKTATARLDGDLVLVAGANDEFCSPWQSEDATETLKSVGYNVKLVVLPGGNHSNVIFKAHVEDEAEWVNVPDDPVGQQVVETILEAIEAAEA